MTSTMRGAYAGRIMREQCRCIKHGRTDGRTNEDRMYRPHKNYSYVTPARGTQIWKFQP